MSDTFEDSSPDLGQKPTNGFLSYQTLGWASLIVPCVLAAALGIATKDAATASLLPGMLAGVGTYASRRGMQAREEGARFFGRLEDRKDHLSSVKLSAGLAAGIALAGVWAALKSQEAEHGTRMNALAAAPAQLDQRVDCTDSDGSRVRGVMVATTPDGQSFRIG